jgi:glycosyltransferase involved in cell wall biosynthesis
MTATASILIPCYNAAPWLAATLESALAQTWPRCEVIVVDDGSRDDSLVVARRFEPRGVKVIAQPNRGASAARNTALRAASGHYIQFLDADDLLTPDKIGAQISLLETAGPDCLASCRWGRFHDDPAQAEFVDDRVFRDFDPVDYLLLHTGEAAMMHPGAWLAPRELLERAGPWDESLTLNDDGEYFARVALAARRILFSPTGASLYRSSLPGSLSRRRDRRALDSVFRSVESIAAQLRRFENTPRVQRVLADYWQRLIYEIYPDAPDLCRRAEDRVREFGGSSLRPTMGSRERLVAGLLGWKLARRLRLSRRS